ncbi:hypothetical protein B0186_11530, partial [Canicola haemoglobinophilus]|uniref:hypothetical protein n=1 Tax=Canicola haemoglobinophilus TaxID=733 RepID=UPI0009C7ADFC
RIWDGVISELLAKYLGHLPDLDSLPQVEDEPIAFAHSVSRVFAQLEKVQTWVSGKDEYLNSLVTQDKKPKEQALWDLPPVPLSLVELSQLLQQVNAPALGGIGQSYLPSLLIGVANLLGNLLHSAMYLIALHSRATNQTVQAMPTEIEIWQGLQELIMRFNPPLEKALTTGKNEG